MENRNITVIDKAEKKQMPDGTIRQMVNVLCFCGKQFVAHRDAINQGLTKSCGCLVLQKQLDRLSQNPKNLSHNPLYRIWHAIKTRCYNQKNYAYKYYGARGIALCDEWKDDFVSFFKWCKLNGHTNGLQIDRINNDGNYEPGNCRFVTPATNVGNRRNTIIIPYKGETKTLKEWSKFLGLPYNVLYSRIQTQQMPVEKAFDMPLPDVLFLDMDLGSKIKEVLRGEGRTQRWLKNKMQENGVIGIDDVKISNKIKGAAGFSNHEISVINKILNTDFSIAKP